MENNEKLGTRLIDCEAGRKMGCQSFCCRLIVRLKPHEVVPNDGGMPAKNCVDKDESGYCIHFDKHSSLCQIWNTRPEVCREYECNSDFLLQVAIRESFRNIVDLVKKAASAYIPRETYKYIPTIDIDGEE